MATESPQCHWSATTCFCPSGGLDSGQLSLCFHGSPDSWGEMFCHELLVRWYVDCFFHYNCLIHVPSGGRGDNIYICVYIYLYIHMIQSIPTKRGKYQSKFILSAFSWFLGWEIKTLTQILNLKVHYTDLSRCMSKFLADVMVLRCTIISVEPHLEQ